MSMRATGFALTLGVTCAMFGSEASAQFCLTDDECSDEAPRCREFSCAQCIDDSDCGGAVCGSDGACGLAPPPQGQCVDNSDCDDWEECVSSLCMPLPEEPEPSVCGDGIVQDDEECDDADTKEGDGCNRCVRELCGDGIVQPELGEECDYFLQSSGECTNQCKLVQTCGDGIWDTWEQCEVGSGGWTDYTCNAETCTRRKIQKAGSPGVTNCDFQQLDTCFPLCVEGGQCEINPGGTTVCINDTFCTYDCSGSHECPLDMHCVMFGQAYGCVAD